MSLKSIVRACVLYAFIEQRRRRFRLQRLKLFPSNSEAVACEAAVNVSRFDLWPSSIREGHGWTLVDVGANDGDFIRAVTRLAAPAAAIAFEPLPACAQSLRPLIESLPAGQLHQVAVGASSGEVELNCTGDSRMSSVLSPQTGIHASYREGDHKIARKLKVRMVRLDDHIAPNIRIGLLKVDVQGYELEVLRGATRTLDQTEALLIEINYTPHYEGAAGFEEVHEFLRAAGFLLYGVSAPYVDDRRPLWADAMCVRTAAGSN
jgi:FkbM family methyltransferase